MSEFYVGQKVVCIDNDLHNEWQMNQDTQGDLRGLRVGNVYTINAFSECWDGSLGLFLTEIPRSVPFSHRQASCLQALSLH